ncbi:MAG: small ribosomal subunit Rsm22 family protein [Blastocatellales bacterium]
MQLPPQLRNAIEQETSKHSLSLLAKAAAELSDRYRNQRQTIERFITTDTHRSAYVAVRMPATFAAARAVFAEIRRLAPETPINSLLDLGAGTGAASWAAVEVFDDLRRITMVEQDRELVRLGKRLAESSPRVALREADWQTRDLTSCAEFADHDLIVCSYSLGEIEPGVARRILKAAWQSAHQAVAVIEPGTMKGFETILALRDELISAGGHIIAPCPHERACPMASAGKPGADWCHFAARFERSSLHRRIKSAELGYEDEKYSYIAASKSPVQPARARIIRHPMRRAGFIQLQLCAEEGLADVTVTRKDKEGWKRARKADWGDAWDI